MEKRKIGELISFVRGVSYKKEQAEREGKTGYTAILRANNINDGIINYDDLVYVPSYLIRQEQIIDRDDIVITMSSGSKAHVGKVAIARKNTEVAFGAFCAKIISKNIYPQFLFYALRDSAFRKYIEAASKGTNINNLKQEYILNYRISVPSLSEQERIVSRIEELFSQLDDGVETLKKTKAQLAVYRQAVLKEAFENCDEQVPIESVCHHVTDGDHMPPPKAESGIPFIMISNVESNAINWNGTAYVGNDYFEKIDNKRRPQVGDVLYTVTGSYGIPILVDFEKKFCFQRHIALLRPNEKVLHKYLYFALMTPGVYSQATKGATGTAQKTVGLGVLRKIYIPFFTDKDKQAAIVDVIESRLSVCDSIEQTVNMALQQADALRQSILKDAFDGGL